MGVLPLRPERSASASSATSACQQYLLYLIHKYCQAINEKQTVSAVVSLNLHDFDLEYTVGRLDFDSLPLLLLKDRFADRGLE